jgi:ornithine cyclodeaminase/alanine dehydrogenase-like protein (mu-crystallin family)
MTRAAAPLRLLTASDLEALLPPAVCIAAVEAAMRATSRRDVVLPLRTSTDVPDTTGRLILMPGVLGATGLASGTVASRVFGVKLVAKYVRPAGDPLGTHVGTVQLLDADRGCLLALLEGGTLTALRTAAASALATRTLAREDARVLTILGTGEEARRHAVAVATVREFREVRIWGRTPARADALADALRPALEASGLRVRTASSAEAAVDGADVVCTTTSAKEPILEGRWIAPGTHLNLVGSAIATTAEVDVECVRRSRVYVDYRPSAAAEAGELRRALAAGAIGEDHVVGEIGDVLLGRVEGRRSADEITLYKSLGIAAQDLAAAAWALAAAERDARGVVVDLGA